MNQRRVLTLMLLSLLVVSLSSHYQMTVVPALRQLLQLPWGVALLGAYGALVLVQCLRPLWMERRSPQLPVSL